MLIDCDLATLTPPASVSSSVSRPASNNRSFSHGDTAPITPAASTASVLTPLEPAPTPAPASTSTSTSTLNGTAVAPNSPFAAANIPDLELLHHYTTFTYKTLPSGAAGAHHELWQIQVVRLGFEHEFLLRGILAVSALHLACLNPSRQEELALRASSHQSIAVQFFHEALNRVDPHNCVAIFAFSCIVVALTFATPRPTLGVGIDADTRIQKEIFDWFHMVRGCNSVVQTQWEPLSQSFLAPLLKKGMIHETAAAHDVCDADKVAELFQLCTGSSGDRTEGGTPDTAGSGGGGGREASTAYTWAIHELVNTYTQVFVLMKRGQDFVPVIFVWPIAIPQHFLVLLSEQRPEALVILAYYAALLQRVDDQWYMHGWARYLVNSIDSTLPDEWASWLKWPKEVTAIS
ncbi:C6 zinc finger domain-containing protein [Arthroderma uncinatum]|uniref:C6 zinc finger domain-containing protein n=1 Tax=Arthroderma uncinatum TaxID=74035 RepID=UPI00144AD3AA|nr:C6 zinc finger domain-containing protein [Arthroderma uncinatum]KAF3491399.1 C6 zinc finger domain-containing protein [Arthroderma uncinatum]